MSKKRTIDSFFKRKEDVPNEPQTHHVDDNLVDAVDMEETITIEPEKIDVSNLEKVNLDTLIRDPGARPSILSYPSNQRDEVRRAYIKLGPY